MSKLFSLSAALLITALACGCSGRAATVNVSAASSLTDAVTEIDKLYQQENPGVAVVANFGGSGTLQKQIENGAPVDVFISASAVQMDALQKEKLIIDNTRKNLLMNKVVLVVLADSRLGISGFKDLALPMVKRIAIGDPRSVPAGTYAQQTFELLGIADTVKQKLIFAGDVRQVLMYVESGNADAGVVFLTDAVLSKGVAIAANAPDEINSTVVYPVAVIKGAKNLNAARDYETYLFGDRAKGVFQKYGFSIAGR
jgi:molybdate transport system substrate-binding protein